jgi:hypothetical protein
VSLDRKVEAADLATADRSRFVGMALQLRRKSTGEILLMAGGQYDRLSGGYIEETVTPHDLPVEESQVDFIRWWALWVASYRDGTPRDVSFAMCAGARRGGKSHATLIAQVAACVEVPGTISWCVVDSFRSRDEVDRALVENVPGAWFHRRQQPEFTYTFANGSIIRILSADNDDALKAGRVDIANLVDLQKLSPAALLNTLGGTIDKNGIVLASANPPRRARGQFVIDLKDKLEEKQLEGSLFFGFDASKNTAVDAGARKRFAAIAEVVDPKLGDADADGSWQGIGDCAYFAFRRTEHVRPPPLDGDITVETTQRKLYKWAPFVGGLDAQSHPHNAVVIAQVFRGLDGRQNIYAVGEIIQPGVERELLDAIDNSEVWGPSNLILVLDASCFWQDAQHTKGRATSDILRAAGFHCAPPQQKKTDKGDHASNPNVEDRVSLVNTLFVQRRLFISPACPHLISALKGCQQKFGKPIGHWAHATDALGYLCWLLEDRVQPRTSPPRRGDMIILPRPVRGIRML